MKPNQLLVIAGACVVAVVLRFPDFPGANFGAMLALSLLCGSTIRHRAVFFLPLGIRLLTDVVIQYKTGYGFFASWPFDYAAYALICLVGSQIQPHRVLAVFGGTVGSIGLYFFLSNLGVWIISDMYPHNLAGLVLCYSKALPFARGTIMGNMLMVPVFFGAWHMATVSSEVSEVVTAD